MRKSLETGENKHVKRVEETVPSAHSAPGIVSNPISQAEKLKTHRTSIE